MTNKIVSAFLALFLLLISQKAWAEWDKALLIGVGKYPFIEDADLIGPPNDVARFKNYLTTVAGMPSSDVRVLVDEKATKKAILSSITSWLKNNSAAGDRVLIYYSGHGSHVADKNGDEADGRDETILPYDFGRGGAKRSGMITDDEMQKALSTLKNRDVILIADSCHSGTLSRAYDPSLPTDTRSRFYRTEPEDDVTGTAVLAELTPTLADEKAAEFTPFSLSAAAANQLAWETAGKGIFTSLLLEAIQNNRADKNKNGKVTIAEALDYIRPKTEAWCKKVPKCRTLGFTPSSDPLVPQFALTGATISETPPADTVTDIVPENDDLGLRVSIEPSATARVGDVNKFRISSDRDGFLLLFDMNSKGDLTLLYPKTDFSNPYQKGQLKAGVPVLIPDPNWGITFKVTQPGEGHLLAIVVDQNVDPQALLQGLKSFSPEPLKDAKQSLERISSQLLAPAVIGKTTVNVEGRNIEYAIVAPPKWSAGLTPYRHVR